MAVLGRDQARSDRQAAELAARLGHTVQPLSDPFQLGTVDLDGVIVASPPETHLAFLQMALARGLPTLCEKPLVLPAQAAAGLQVVAGFRQRGVLLEENCQWPFMLPVFDQIVPDWRQRPVRTLVMGLSPSAPGPGMIVDSLTHLLSVAQAVAPIAATTRLCSVRRQGPADGDAQILELQFDAPGLAARLELRACPQQPRPAFVAIDGVRVDRRIGAGYRLEFATAERSVAAPDPMAALVYRFVSQLPHQQLDRIHTSADAIAERLRLYDEILRRLEPGAAG